MSPQERADYEAAVSLLILEAYETVDLPLPDDTPGPNDTPSEQERKIAFWTNALLPTVPLDELRPAFDLAAARHTDPRRAVNPIDVKLAYPDMLAERKRRAEGTQDAAPDSDARQCTFCDEEQMCQIWVPASNLYVTAPCRDCRPKAFDQYMANWHQKNGAKQEPVSLALVQKVKTLLTLTCDSCSREVVDQYPQERPCNDMLNRGNNEEPPDFCKGTLKAA